MSSDSDDRVVVPAARYLKLIVPISNFAIDVWRDANGTIGSPVQQTAHGLLDRAICWLRTLQDLTGIHHYQATLAAVRGLLETTVDLAYLTKDRANNDRIEAWEQSAKFKAAEALCAITDPKARPRFELDSQREFVRTNTSRIGVLRQQYWPRKNGKPAKHPDRWTGQTLIADVRAVDAAFPGLKLERAYREIYNVSCWSLHGSGLIVTRSGEGRAVAVASAMAMSILQCGDLAFASAEFAARVLGSLSPQRTAELKQHHDAWRRADGFT